MAAGPPYAEEGEQLAPRKKLDWYFDQDFRWIVPVSISDFSVAFSGKIPDLAILAEIDQK